jgi:tetratricopeptide (TPR) repeat protein
MAMQQARLQREAALRQQAEAKRQAEEAGRQAEIKAETARLERIHVAVTAGSKAAAEGRLEEALQRLQEALRDVRRYEGGIVGVGVDLEMRDGFPVVVRVGEDTPASRAGLKVSDRIIRIDGQYTQNMGREDVLKRAGGQKGKTVALSIMREGVSLPTNYEIVRDTVVYGDQQVREEIIKVVRAMPAPPPLPENVMRSMVRGETKLKMGGTGSYEAAAKEMEQAVMEAPWFVDGYYNLGIVQEKAGNFWQGAQNLRLCLLAAPNSRNAAAIQAKVYELEVMEEEQKKMSALQGVWYDGQKYEYALKVEGKKILLQ